MSTSKGEGAECLFGWESSNGTVVHRSVDRSAVTMDLARDPGAEIHLNLDGMAKMLRLRYKKFKIAAVLNGNPYQVHLVLERAGQLPTRFFTYSVQNTSRTLILLVGYRISMRNCGEFELVHTVSPSAYVIQRLEKMKSGLLRAGFQKERLLPRGKTVLMGWDDREDHDLSASNTHFIQRVVATVDEI